MDRYKEAMKTGLIGIVFNTILFLLKLMLGWISGSVALVADAFNNLSDSLASLVTLLGYYFSSKPADAEHPFGHERSEYISGFVISIIMLFFGFEVAIESFKGLFNPNTVVITNMLVYALVFSVMVKFFMYLYYKAQAKKLDTNLLNAAAMDSLNDVLITSGILVGFAIDHYFSIQLDSWIGLGLSGLIIFTGIKMISGFISELLGERPDQELVDSIVKVLEKTHSIHGFHDLMIHIYGKNHRYAVVHVEVDERLSLIEAHHIIDDIEDNVLKECGIILDVHLDPLDISSPIIKEVVSVIKESLRRLDPRLTFHDVRFLDGILLFDVVKSEAIVVSNDDIYDMITSNLIKKSLDYSIDIQFDSLDLLSGK